MRARRLIPALAALVLGALIAAPASAMQQYRFPLNGPHSYGDLAVTGFGAKRANGSIHLGQDVIANCGTPVVAAHSGFVKSAGYSAGYGFYVVIRGKGTRFDFVYGHMKGRSWARRKDRVKAGQRIGSVGQTGSDSGVCHLHFELWKGRWFAGGSRTDPLPHLEAWDKYSGGPLTEGPTPIGQDSASASRRLFYDAAE
jgi:murein DD-endopeptidase MepM/ murein hydrolase activator NlpD